MLGALDLKDALDTRFEAKAFDDVAKKCTVGEQAALGTLGAFAACLRNSGVPCQALLLVEEGSGRVSGVENLGGVPVVDCVKDLRLGDGSCGQG